MRLTVCTEPKFDVSCSSRDIDRRLKELFFFNDTATTEIYTLSLHDALPISVALAARPLPDLVVVITDGETAWPAARPRRDVIIALLGSPPGRPGPPPWAHVISIPDRQADHLTGLATSFRPG